MGEYNKFIEIYPGNPSVYWHLWEYYIKLEEELKAVESLQNAFLLVPEDKPYVDTLKEVYNKIGIIGLKEWLIFWSIKNDDRGSWRGIAVYYSEIGEKEKALDWLEKAYEWKVPGLPGINAISEFNNLRNEPRFQALLRKMGLTAYQK